jgi:hypothetical protein
MNEQPPIEVLAGPHTKRLMEKIAASGTQSETFTQEEKLALVADGMMDPKEVGLTSAEEAHLAILPEADKIPKFGKDLILTLATVPLEIRAEWAYQESKIILAPADATAWKEEWINKNRHSYRIQGKAQCGTAHLSFERHFKDPVLGIAVMLALAGQLVEAAYLQTESPPVSDMPENEQAESKE